MQTHKTKLNNYDYIKRLEAEQRLEYLRGEIEKECVSYGEIAELASLAEYIDKSDVQLLEWSGVSEEDYNELNK